MSTDQPIKMRLPCPECGELHVDAGKFATKVHHTHACQHCGMVWRPAVVPTVGVRFLPGFKDEDAARAEPQAPRPAPVKFIFKKKMSMPVSGDLTLTLLYAKAALEQRDGRAWHYEPNPMRSDGGFILRVGESLNAFNETGILEPEWFASQVGPETGALIVKLRNEAIRLHAADAKEGARP